MLHFTPYKPHPALRGYLSGYWLIEGGAASEIWQLVPDGHPELFFVLSESVAMRQFLGKQRWCSQSEGGLIGQTTGRFSIEPAPFSRTLYVKMYPWVPQSMFGLPAWESNDSALEFGSLSNGPAFRALGERLRNLPDLPAMGTVLDAFFLKMLPLLSNETPFVRFATQRIYHTNGTVSMDALRGHIQASTRHIEKTFKQYVGMPPKQYAQLIRIKKASMWLTDPRFKGKIGQVAHALDYYDQSHFLKDFKAVAHQTPSQFLQRQLNFSKEDVIAYLGQWDYS